MTTFKLFEKQEEKYILHKFKLNNNNNMMPTIKALSMYHLYVICYANFDYT